MPSIHPQQSATSSACAEVTDGTPEALSYDPGTKQMTYRFTTTRPDGRRSRVGLSSIVLPRWVYPSGYEVMVTGGRVVSRPCATDLVLHTRLGASQVEVTVTPGGACPS